jgi:polygalacturonase
VREAVNEREQFDRRHLLGLAARGAFLASAVVSPALAAQAASANSERAHGAANSEGEVRSPDGRLIFSVRQFGASGDGNQIDTPSIQTAIDACSAARGGIVYFPPGDYLSGTIVLKDDVTLYLEAGSTLVASGKLANWQLFPFPRGGGERHFVYADNATNIAIMGTGRIHGSAEHFRRPRTPQETPGYGDRMEGGRIAAATVAGTGPRPDAMLCFRRCKGLRIYDVTLTSPPNWTLHPVNCDSVFIRNITIRNPIEGPNSDGIDPDGCTNVLIADCNVTTGDDGICLKNRDQLGLGIVSRNIAVTNCTVYSNCNGLKIDEATAGAGFENIAFSNCTLYCVDEPDINRTITGIHVDSGYDGGFVDGVSFSNITMSQVRNAIFIRNTVRSWHRSRGAPESTPPPGRIRNIAIDNCFAKGQTLTSAIAGLEGQPIEGISLSNVHITSREGGSLDLASKEVPELPSDYPEVTMFRRLPSYGLYARHVRGLSLRNVNVELEGQDMRPALFAEDVAALDIDGFRYHVPGGSQPAIRLRNSSRVFLRGCRATEGTSLFLSVVGSGTGSITVIGNDFSGAQNGIEAGSEVSAGAIFLNANRPAKG